MRARRKGFTIVEVVISLAVISIMSVTATTIILSSLGAQNSARNEFFAENLCANFFMAFQSAADSVTEYSNDPGNPETTALEEIYVKFAEKMSNEKIFGITLQRIDEPTSESKIMAEAYLGSDWGIVNSKEQAKYICSFEFVQSEDKVNFTAKVTKNGFVIGERSGFVVKRAAE